MSSHGKREVMQRSFVKSARVASLLWLVGVGACTSVLGIEDLHDGPRPGSEANGGDGEGGSETTNVKGGSKNGGSTNGGSDAGAGNVGPGGEGGTTVTPVGGEAGVGGEGGAPFVPSPVTGKLINEWGMPIGNIALQIGTTQSVTDDKGNFTIPDVGETYDVSLVNGDDGWVFQGLSRRDPTLQVFSTDPDVSRGCNVQPTFIKTVKGVNDQIAIAVGTPTGNSRANNVSDPANASLLGTYWTGAAATAGTAHALQWSKDASTLLPVSYKAYDTKALPLAAGVESAVTFDLTADVISAKAITGNATAAGDADHTNYVFVRFSSGAWMKLLEETLNPGTAGFSYLVPQLMNASITLMTFQGSFYGEIGMVHKNGLSAGDIVGDLKSPRPPALLTPPPGDTDVDPATAKFSITPSAESPGTFLYVFLPDISPGHLFVVTSKKSLVGVPTVVDGAWVLSNDELIHWWVETHGRFANVDDMAGPTGFIDTFGKYYENGEPIGPGDEDGEWTSSESHQFTTKAAK